MFQLNIDISQLILAELNLIDTIKLSELDHEHNQLIHQDWIWSARIQLDYPDYANLPIFNHSLEKYRYIKQTNGQVYVLTYSGFRCYYYNIAGAYAKFRKCVITACNLQPGEYDLEKVKEYRASIYNGLVLLYRENGENRDQETELIYVSDRDSGILYSKFLALSNTSAAPYYCYEWHVAYELQCICNGTNNSLFELPSEANLDSIPDISTNDYYCYRSYYQTNSGKLTRDYPDFS